MTEERMALAELLQKSGDGDFLRSVAEAVLQILMEADVEGRIGAGRHERTGDRLNYRNGYRERSLDTRLGSLSLRIPKLRQGSYFPPFLEPRKTAEKAPVMVIQEAWIGGVSTRRVDELVQAMGLTGISKSQVSKLCKDIDERVNAFLDRSIEGEWPYLWLDATYLKVRDGGRIISVAAIIAVAVNTEGRREIVGLGIGPSEAEPFWSSFIKSLVKRGLHGVKLVISDAHDGLRLAITRVLGATWQCCRVHWIRNALAHVQKGSTPWSPRRSARLPATDAEAAHQTLATRCRSASPALAETRHPDGRQRARRVGPHALPRPAPHQAPFHQSVGAAEQGGQATGRRRRHLPQQSQHHPAHRRGPARAE
jgi:transposase-like protein